MKERDSRGRFVKKNSEKAEKKSKNEEEEEIVKEDLHKNAF